MAERKYSVSEIDEMRSLVKELCMGWCAHSPTGAYAAGDYKPETVELRLRTYMLNGTSVDDLRDRVNEDTRRLMESQRRIAEQEAA